MSNFLAMLAGLARTDMSCYHLAAKMWHNSHKRHISELHRSQSERLPSVSLLRDHVGSIKKTDSSSGIILASGCCYLGRPENPPEHWVEYPPSGAHAHKAWPCDTSAGGAASQIYLDNQSEPRASPNPAGESSAFLPVIAQRFIIDCVNENTDTDPKKLNKTKQNITNTQGCDNKYHSKNIYPSRSVFIYSDVGIEIGLWFLVHHNIKM